MSSESAITWLQAQPTTAPDGHIVLDVDDGIATLWLDHDAARNALTVGMMQDLAHVVATLEASPPRLWLLRGRGSAFCAGGHLGDVRAHLATPEAGRQMAVAMASLLSRLEALPCPGVTVVHGAAVGGGAELAVTGDLCLMQDDAVLSFAQAERGVACGWGGARRLVDRVGPRRALDVLLLRPRVDAWRAAQMGLAAQVADASDAVAALVEHVRALPPGTVRAAVQAVRGQQTEVDAFTSVWGHGAHRDLLEGLPWGRR